MVNAASQIRVLIVALIAGILWPTYSLANETFVLSSREQTLVNRFAENILTKAYSRLNITIKFNLYPGDHSIVEANEGRADGEVARLETVLSQYTNLRKVPIPLFQSDLAVFIRADSTVKDFDWDSFEGYRLTTINGFKYVKNKLSEYAPVIVETSAEAINLVEKGDVDIAVLNRFLGVLAIAETRAKKVKLHNPPIERKPVYHLLHKKHESLIPKLATVLQNMERNGETHKMWEAFTRKEVQKVYRLGEP